MPLLLALLPVAWGKPAAEAWTAEKLIAKNVEARGGKDALAAIGTLRFTGALLVNGGSMQMDWSSVQVRPDKVREELTLQGLTQVSAWDGVQAWRIDPFQGRRTAERIPPDDAKGLVEGAPIDGPLLDAKAHGWPIRYLGVDDVDGTAAHKLEIARPGGDLQYVWLDPDAFLEIRLLSHRLEHGVLVEAQTDLGDYEKVAGVYFPLLIEIGPKDAPPAWRAKIQIAQGEANAKVDDAAFRMPEAK